MGREKLALDLRGESLDQRLKRMPDTMTPYDLVKLRLYENIDSVVFAVKRGKLPAIFNGKDIHFKKIEIKRWLKTRDIQ